MDLSAAIVAKRKRQAKLMIALLIKEEGRLKKIARACIKILLAEINYHIKKFSSYYDPSVPVRQKLRALLGKRRELMSFRI